ncbi:MAG: glycosyltransferase [Patescibacteria group bacterium]|nr:glycosyltransferase [Patescibacteria group bacterium]
MKIGVLVPHIFAQQEILEKVIFAPVHLAVNMADMMSEIHETYLFTPGRVQTRAKNITVNLSLFNEELARELCTLPELITKNPLSFVSLSRQVQAELASKAFELCNTGKLDILHVFMCESEIPLYFSNLVNIPVVFTHHDPYNFYRKYRVTFPKLKNLNYVSISKSQQKTAAAGMNFVANVYNGIDLSEFKFRSSSDDYFAYLGRIIRVKGCHTAISACIDVGADLRIVGKYYSGAKPKDEDYWTKYIKPKLDDQNIRYDGFVAGPSAKSRFLGGAKALLFPVEWDEPFGVVMIEAMACGTPVIAFDRGSVKEIIDDGKTGFVVKDLQGMKQAMKKIDTIDREECRKLVKEKFTVKSMTAGYLRVYKKLLQSRSCT